MRIKEIRVEDLFGLFTHSIPLDKDRVTILHGPNGIGKTVLLKMIASLVRGDSSIFERVPFRQLQVYLDDGSKGNIRRIEEQVGDKIETKLDVRLYDSTGKEIHAGEPPIEVPATILDRIDRFVPTPYRRYGSGWRDRTGEFYSLHKILKLFPQVAKLIPEKYRSHPFKEIVRDMSVLFVETTRLSAEDRAASRRLLNWPSLNLSDTSEDDEETDDERQQLRRGLRVYEYSRDIASRIKSRLADYGRFSQNTDRTFPVRLVQWIKDGEETLPESAILEQMSELEKSRKRLISLGFLDKEEPELTDLTVADVRRSAEALTIYVDDVAKKLDVLKELAHPVGKLIDIINARFKYKQLAVDRENGFRVRTLKGTEIPLEDLSSGEQHELVVLYELLFRASPDSLVLIDEPEISLHIAWQSRFLADLIDILAITNSYGIVATHSPAIIGNRRDLMVELRGPEPETEAK